MKLVTARERGRKGRTNTFVKGKQGNTERSSERERKREMEDVREREEIAGNEVSDFTEA